MLTDENVKLVVLEERHLDDIMKGWNNLELRQFLGSYIPHSRETEREWIANTIEDMNKRRSFVFAIERITDEAFIGTIGLHDIDWLSRTCVLGIAIHNPEHWGKGLGTEALRLIINFGWNHLNLRRIELSVHDFNERAKHVYEKLGFIEFGVAHAKYFIKGKYVNTHYMELFRENE